MATHNSDVVGVALVVDSSSTLAGEWRQILPEYVAPLMQRVMENHHPRQLQLAYVCYGPSHNRPQPILCRNFFREPMPIIHELREQPTNYGIGQTGSGADNGLAVLEGLVAAVELFDSLKETRQNAVSYIIHIAACAPDTAERPLHNLSPRLDSVTWDSLPLEIKKRDIHYTSILLKRIPKLSQLFHAAATGVVQQSWFNVRSPHQLHICGLPPRKPSGKRPAEPNVPAAADQSPGRRARVQPSQASPKPSPKKTETVTPKVTPAIPPSALAPSVPSQTAPQPQAAAAPTAAAPTAPLTSTNLSSMPIAQLALFLERFTIFENQVKTKYQELKAQAAAGNPVDLKQTTEIQAQANKVAELRQAIIIHFRDNPTKGEEIKRYQQMKRYAQQQHMVQQQQQANAMASSQAASTSGASGSVPTNVNEQVPQQIPGVQMPQLTPEMVAQFQKLEQQRGRTPHISAATSANPPPTDSALLHQNLVWQGKVAWTDPSSPGTQHVAGVICRNVKPSQMVTATDWPPVVQLTLSDEPAPPILAIGDFLDKHQNIGSLLHIAEDPRVGNNRFPLLANYLSSNNKPAIARWQDSNGNITTRLFVFPIKGQNALGALHFPNGTIDLPTGRVVGITLSELPVEAQKALLNLPQQAVEMIANTPPEERPQRIKAILQTMLLRQQQQAQQHANRTAGGAMQSTSNPPTQPQMNMGAPQSMNGMLPNANAMQFPQNPGVLHRRTPSGGRFGNISPEMLQAFMQRNAGSAGGHE